MQVAACRSLNWLSQDPLSLPGPRPNCTLQANTRAGRLFLSAATRSAELLRLAISICPRYVEVDQTFTHRSHLLLEARKGVPLTNCKWPRGTPLGRRVCRTRGKMISISIPRFAVTQLSCKLKTVDLTPLDPQDPC